VIVVGGVVLAGGAVFSKKFLELAADDAYKAVKGKLSKLKRRKPEETQPLALVITVGINGVQVKNVLAKGPDDIKDFQPGLIGRTDTA